MAAGRTCRSHVLIAIAAAEIDVARDGCIQGSRHFGALGCDVVFERHKHPFRISPSLTRLAQLLVEVNPSAKAQCYL